MPCNITTTNVDDYERTMRDLYEIANKIYNADLPIVFKGMLVTRLALKENEFSFIRPTRDIDGDWTGEEIPLKELEDKINNAISDIPNITVVAHRDYGEHKSAGFEVRRNNIAFSSFDLSVRKNNYYKLYDIDGVKIYGQTVDKIIADKLCVVSTRKIFRRIKDFLDLYCLSGIYEIKKDIILDILHHCDREIGDFSPLLNQKENIQHAYETMNWISNKPNFEEVYKVNVDIANIFLN